MCDMAESSRKPGTNQLHNWFGDLELRGLLAPEGTRVSACVLNLCSPRGLDWPSETIAGFLARWRSDGCASGVVVLSFFGPEVFRDYPSFRDAPAEIVRFVRAPLSAAEFRREAALVRAPDDEERAWLLRYG